jgi:hypothetical protein
MLFGGSKESRPADGEWLVSLPEDQSEPILVILNIIHGRFGLVPTKPSLAKLYGILEVTNKYDMSEVTRPWAASWMESIKETYLQDGVSLPELLFVAWELGDAELFETLTRRVVEECRKDEGENLVSEDGRNLAEVLTRPPHLYGMSKVGLIWPERFRFRVRTDETRTETIVAQRTQLIDSMLNVYEARIANLLQGNPCDTPLECDGMALGTLVKSVFNATTRLPPQRTDEVNESVSEVLAFLTQGFIGMNSGCNQFDHRQLGTQDISKICEIVEKRESIVSPESMEFMASQRKKTGIKQYAEVSRL